MIDKPRILLVEDEPEILWTLQANVERHGYLVTTAETGKQALATISGWLPDVVVLDLGLPDLDGLAIVREVRSTGRATPIIILSARSGDRDKVSALDLGADDYLTKPFSLQELLARIRVALRHAGPPSATGLHQFGDLAVDLAARQVTLAGQVVKLTPTEWELLKALIASANHVVTHQALLRQVWGSAYGEESNYLHVFVANLRRKIEPDPRHPRYLLTEPGVGYRFRSD